jgi:polysaccharide export outer membrane protein
MIKRFLPVILLTLLIFSCVSNKKILYLQEETDLYGPAPKDSILRSYIIEPYDYHLQHEDVLSIEISSLTPKEYDFFSQGLPQGQGNMNMGGRGGGGALFGYLIDRNGEIEFPVVGKVKFAGLTIYEAESMVQEMASEYLEEPVVKVRLLNFRFTVIADVRGETINTFNNRLSMMEGIGLAGGLGELSDLQNVKVIRQHEDAAMVHYVNLLEEDYIESPYYYIHPNDVIIVPPLKQRSFRNYFGENLGLIVSSLSLLLLVLNLSRNGF